MPIWSAMSSFTILRSHCCQTSLEQVRSFQLNVSGVRHTLGSEERGSKSHEVLRRAVKPMAGRCNLREPVLNLERVESFLGLPHGGHRKTPSTLSLPAGHQFTTVLGDANVKNGQYQHIALAVEILKPKCVIRRTPEYCRNHHTFYVF